MVRLLALAGLPVAGLTVVRLLDAPDPVVFGVAIAVLVPVPG